MSSAETAREIADGMIRVIEAAKGPVASPESLYAGSRAAQAYAEAIKAALKEEPSDG